MSGVYKLAATDKEWVMRVWKPSEKILGPRELAWKRSWMLGPKPNDCWIGIEQVAFAHYLKRRDGINVLYEIGVDPQVKRGGYGRQLIFHIGFPMELKTDADNEESNAFYRRLCFTHVGQKRSKNGKKLFNIYRRL